MAGAKTSQGSGVHTYDPSDDVAMDTTETPRGSGVHKYDPDDGDARLGMEPPPDWKLVLRGGGRGANI